MLYVSGFPDDYGYTDVSLNLGDSYAMVTNRQKRAGLLLHPDDIKGIPYTFFQ